jgi:hypothetical protein
MPRPGCVWTHTILVGFSDIPALESATSLPSLFRRPRGDGSSYNAKLPYPPEGVDLTLPDEDASRRILFAVYANPSKPIISSSLGQRERDALALAIWDQQWPRLNRTFRFCTLSFADRSSTAGIFDLQFLPASGRVPRAQFRAAVDADRQDFAPTDWLDGAVSDLREGPGGSLRRFLRSAGGDVSGREAFAPLATLHMLSTHFATDPDSVEKAILVLDRTLAETQGQAARKLIANAAAVAADSLGPAGLNFVLRNFELIEPNESAAAAERVGQALWKIDPDFVFRLLQDDPPRRAVALRAIASLPTWVLLNGVCLASEHLSVVVNARPDIATEAGYWSLPDAWNAKALFHIARRSEIVPGAVDAMLRSDRPSIQIARAAFGSETILTRLVALMERTPDAALETARAWLSEACLDPDALAHVLGDGSIEHAATLDAIARAAAPDQVPNDSGEDPWLVAIGHIAWSDATPYLAGFLLARAFGPSTRSSAELIQLTFDTVYAAVERSELPRMLGSSLTAACTGPTSGRTGTGVCGSDIRRSRLLSSAI